MHSAVHGGMGGFAKRAQRHRVWSPSLYKRCPRRHRAAGAAWEPRMARVVPSPTSHEGRFNADALAAEIKMQYLRARRNIQDGNGMCDIPPGRLIQLRTV